MSLLSLAPAAAASEPLIRLENVAKRFVLPGGGHFDTVKPSSLAVQHGDVFGLADKQHSFPAQLSGGQKQRVAIARALATLRDINVQLGVTIVIVTHELPVIDALCRQVAVIEDGQIAEQFAVGDSRAPAVTRLGRELQQLRAREAALARLAWPEAALA